MGLILHYATSFAIADDAGDFLTASEGYYCDDVRHLSRLQLELDGQPAVRLGVRRAESNCATYHLTNPRLDGACEATLAIVRTTRLDAALHEEIAIQNFGDGEARFTLALRCDADFAELFEVKQRVESGTTPPHRGRAKIDRDGRGRVILHRKLHGAELQTELTFSEAPRFHHGAALFRVRLARGERFLVEIVVASRRHGRHDEPRHASASVGEVASLETDHEALGRAYEQAARDIRVMQWKGAEVVDEPTVCGGIPWYMALFGRDSLIASYLSLLHDPSLARGTLSVLARLQGTRHDPGKLEEPGKILHEHRPQLEASARPDVPRYPNYGTVDATQLFVMTLAEYLRLTDDTELAASLWPSVERALDWIEERLRRDGGFVAYGSRDADGPKNRGWKDSPDGVRFSDGRIAIGRIALVEVQGYCAAAFDCAAEIGERLGRGRVAEWRKRGEAMRRRLDARFWLPARARFAEALCDGERADALTSNPGHLLFARAISDERAAAVAGALLSEAMFSGFGVRTMGSGEGGYNPMSYHCGSVWPHDNALFLVGLRRYGLDDAARRVASALLDAVDAFPRSRPPELFSGFARADTVTPVAYPDANSPQAWATAAVLALPRILCGLDVDVRARALLVKPLPLAGMTRLCIRRVRLLGHEASLALSWEGDRCRLRVDGLPEEWSVRAPDGVVVEAGRGT